MGYIIKPDFSKAYIRANKILVESEVIAEFPFSAPNLVMETLGIKCQPYKSALSRGIDIFALGSDSAYFVEYCGKKIIFYNEKNCRERIYFSILHEFGHPSLLHLFNQSKSFYRIYEIEANYFAAQLAMPEQILRECSRRGIRIDVDFISENFGVSRIAAEKRLSTIEKTRVDWKSKEETMFDDAILEKFSNFIDKLSANNDVPSLDYSNTEYIASRTWL